jgi:RHS repeat-associated protein
VRAQASPVQYDGAPFGRRWPLSRHSTRRRPQRTCRPGTGLLTDTYTYPSTNNQLQSIALGAGGTRSFTYDAAGNVTYDNAGRMASFSLNGILRGNAPPERFCSLEFQAEYAYNQLGQQIIRRLTQTGVTIHSVYGPDGNRIAEYNEATGALIRQYIWLEGAPIAVIEGGVVSFVRSDHIGRPVFATNASGIKTWTAAYLPFGGVRVSTGTPPTARFPGQWFQSETGLHQNWMRDYDPTTGRYMQADPLGLVAGASVYGYALQSPGRYTDQTGESPLCIGIAADIAISVAIGYYFDEDGCYSAEELWWDAGFGAAGGAAFRGAGLLYKAWHGGGAAGGALTNAIRESVTHGHHPIPKFLGGFANQTVTRLPQAIHTGTGGFHSQLNAALREAFGRVGGGRNGSAEAWRQFFLQNPGTHRQAMDLLLDVSRNFDAANGTAVTQAVWNSVINGAFRTFP